VDVVILKRVNVLYRLNSLSIRWKLIAMFLCISLMAVLVVGLMSFESTRSVIVQIHQEEMELRLNVYENELRHITNSIDYTSARVALNQGVRRLLGNSREYTPEQRGEDILSMRSILSDSVYRQNADSIYVLGENGEVYSNDPLQLMKSVPLEPEELAAFRSVTDNVIGSGSLMTINGHFYLPYIRKIHYPGTELVGYAVINVRLENIDAIYGKLAKESLSDVYVVDRSGNIISSSVPGARGSSLKELLPNEKDDNAVSINGERYIYFSKHNEKLNWNVYAFKKKSEIVKAANQTGSIMLSVALFSFVVSVLLAVWFAGSITRPIIKLIGDMENAESGALVTTFRPLYQDEIGRLGRSFISMMKRLNQSIIEIYTMEEEKRIAEFKVFEAQINPHFLYNTLTTIIWLIENNENDQAVDVTYSLSNMFRELMGRGAQKLITLEQEYRHVVSYTEIQKVRYKDKFVCLYLVDETLMQCNTIRIIVQPLVENAIYHGVKHLEHGGLIKITCERDGGDIVLEVLDNGDNVTEQRLQELNDFLESSERRGSGIGIRSVHDRVRYHYGPNYGLDFRKEGVFTVARVRIPMEKEEDR